MTREIPLLLRCAFPRRFSIFPLRLFSAIVIPLPGSTGMLDHR
ncbi:hypothetical protein [Prosthecochloris sp. GSB1]|nr:hypothetical protein [Prosthecochloris sp. GSB1]